MDLEEQIKGRDFEACRTGQPGRRPQRRGQRERDTQIQRRKEEFDSGRLPLFEFLEVCSNFFNPKLVRSITAKLNLIFSKYF